MTTTDQTTFEHIILGSARTYQVWSQPNKRNQIGMNQVWSQQSKQDQIWPYQTKPGLIRADQTREDLTRPEVSYTRLEEMIAVSPWAPPEDCTGVVTYCLVFTSAVSSMYVMLVLTPSGQSTWSISLLSCSKKTIRTNKALNMKKANTDLFLSSMRSAAIRACKQMLQHIPAISTELTPVTCSLPEISEILLLLLEPKVPSCHCTWW